MTLLAQALTVGEQLSSLHMLARNLTSRLLLPQILTRKVLQKYLRKAIQNRSWYQLSQLQRALLYTASKTVHKVKSPVLRQILEEILLTIELASTRGQAIYYGLIILIKKSPNMLQTLLSKTKQLLGKLLFLGISYLNNSPMYRIYG